MPPQKSLELIIAFSKAAGYKMSTHNMLYFYILIINYQKEKVKKQSHSQLHEKE